MSRTTGLSRRLAVPYHRLAGNRGLTAELEDSHGAAAKFLDPILRGRITAGELGPGCRTLAVGRRHGPGASSGEPLPVLTRQSHASERSVGGSERTSRRPRSAQVLSDVGWILPTQNPVRCADIE